MYCSRKTIRRTHSPLMRMCKIKLENAFYPQSNVENAFSSSCLYLCLPLRHLLRLNGILASAKSLHKRPKKDDDGTQTPTHTLTHTCTNANNHKRINTYTHTHTSCSALIIHFGVHIFEDVCTYTHT